MFDIQVLVNEGLANQFLQRLEFEGLCERELADFFKIDQLENLVDGVTEFGAARVFVFGRWRFGFRFCLRAVDFVFLQAAFVRFLLLRTVGNLRVRGRMRELAPHIKRLERLCGRFDTCRRNRFGIFLHQLQNCAYGFLSVLKLFVFDKIEELGVLGFFAKALKNVYVPVHRLAAGAHFPALVRLEFREPGQNHQVRGPGECDIEKPAPFFFGFMLANFFSAFFKSHYAGKVARWIVENVWPRRSYMPALARDRNHHREFQALGGVNGHGLHHVEVGALRHDV